MKIYRCAQRSAAWYRLRAGIPTTSAFKRIVTPKGKLSAQSADYMAWLLAEWMLGQPLEGPQTEWMIRGEELEDLAVKSYCFERDVEVEEVGFITDDSGLIGCSPDRLVGPDGILEIKCPSPQVHAGYMLHREVDQEYWPQVQGQLLIAEREWVDIQSYHPALPTVILRVKRDEPYMATLRVALDQFVERMVEAREDLMQRYGPFKGQEASPA